MMRFVAGIALALLACTAAEADSPRAAPVPPAPHVSIQAYGRQNPACRSWTDGCVLCTSDGSGHSQCSTPGIACQPHGLTCKALAPQ